MSWKQNLMFQPLEKKTDRNPLSNFLLWALFLCLLVSSGCGATNRRLATEQILVSNAVDRAIEKIDFSALGYKNVYLDTTYLRTVKGTGFVNADYIVSALRQQLVAANCYLQEKPEEAEIICEARVGALGTDSHGITYGFPQSNSLSTAASLFPNAPPIPMIPEIAFARSESEDGAAKVSVFVYERETKEPFWQSGTLLARSSARDTWVLGAGPIQRGTIYDGTLFAGTRISLSRILEKKKEPVSKPEIPYSEEHIFAKEIEEEAVIIDEEDAKLRLVDFEEEVEGESKGVDKDAPAEPKDKKAK